MRILFLAANPSLTPRLDLEGELRSLERELAGTSYRREIALVAKHAVQPDDLVRCVREEKPTVVHFSGHGSSAGIVLRNEDGGEHVVEGDALALFLENRGVELVVLNACYSDDQARRLSGVVKAVIGTTNALDDDAAKRFTVAFYRSLGNGCTVKDSFRDGVDAVRLHGHDDVSALHTGDLSLTLAGPSAQLLGSATSRRPRAAVIGLVLLVVAYGFSELLRRRPNPPAEPSLTYETYIANFDESDLARTQGSLLKVPDQMADAIGQLFSNTAWIGGPHWGRVQFDASGRTATFTNDPGRAGGKILLQGIPPASSRVVFGEWIQRDGQAGRLMVRLNGYGEAAVRWGPAFTSDSQWLRPENRFVLAADGVLVDQSNQRQWQKADNSFSNLEAFRGDLTWNDARSYCEAKGPAWRLPTVDELRGLYEESGTLTTSCGSSDCKVSPLFQLSKNQFWSGSTASPGTAYRVVLVNGQRAAVSTDDSVGKRALCVRDAYP